MNMSNKVDIMVKMVGANVVIRELIEKFQYEKLRK